MKKDSGKGGKREKESVFYRVCYAIFSGIVGFLFQIRVIGAENEPQEGGFIVCANHTAASDPVVVCKAFRHHQICYMAKKELFRIPLFSGFIRKLGAFPIDRGGSDVGAIRKAVSLVEEGHCMGIFPQGHRYPGVDPRTTPTKNGAALICTRTHANVVPAYILRKGNRPRLFRRTYVIIGKMIPFEELGYDPEAPAGEYARITGVIFDRVCGLGEEFAASHSKKNKK